MSTCEAIEIVGLCSRYDGADALRDISLCVHQGEIFGLAGLDGAGKTTLLKSILRLVVPAAGSVHLFGQPHEQPGSRTQLAYLPEKFQPPSHLPGYDFVRLSLGFYGRRVRRAVVSGLAEEIDLDPAALRKPISSYAKGMAQKLGVLATLLADRPLLLLDEPMSGLDPKARLLLKRQLLLARGRGRTILMSSHILADHDELCDRVAVLHHGRLGYVGSPAAFKESQGAPTLETAFHAAIERPRWAASG
ncbi:MAG TPA: ABC transporter ATP-binding protein [Geminicoccaceae bacterium]|nr:ABC transporter ATP-binding protein [Geminicoccaceae bacterium]